MHRMSTIKDMALLRTELYLRDHVPRLSDDFHLKQPTETSTHNLADRVDAVTGRTPNDATLVLPTRRRLIKGLEQDDFLGKMVSNLAWSFVILQRMIALSAFAYFHPIACASLCVLHYLLMLASLFVIAHGQRPAVERLLFYVFLAYVYVFCIVELKIKFNRPRRTLIAYAVLVIVQNVAMSLWWFARRADERFWVVDDPADATSGTAGSASSQWWFGFMFAAVMLSGLYALLCWLVYFYLLKPSARVLFVERSAQSEDVTGI